MTVVFSVFHLRLDTNIGFSVEDDIIEWSSSKLGS